MRRGVPEGTHGGWVHRQAEGYRPAYRGQLSHWGAPGQHLGPLDGPGTDAMAELPRDEYPLLSATARVAQRLGPDEEFRGGIAIILQGLVSLRRT